MKKKIAVLAMASVLTLSGCSLFQSNTYSAIGTYDFADMDLVQLEPPQDGQMMAVIETTEGAIKAVLYPEYAPNTVDNFVKRANEGYYDGKDVYAIVNEALFMTGSYNEEGTQGFTDDGEPIPNEHSVDLWTFKGALCAYSGQYGYGDSRFFVVDSFPFTEEDAHELRAIKGQDGVQKVPEELVQAFLDNECIANIAGQYTVFGQTIEGFEVIEKICGSEYDEKTMRPVNEIKINSVEITEYASSEEEAVQ